MEAAAAQSKKGGRGRGGRGSRGGRGDKAKQEAKKNEEASDFNDNQEKTTTPSTSSNGNGNGNGKTQPNNKRLNNSANRQEKKEEDQKHDQQQQQPKKRNGNGRGKQKSSSNNNQKMQSKYPSHWSYEKCMKLYVSKDPTIVRGKLRVLPAKDGMAFVACDRGSVERDVILETAVGRNRGLNGDIVFVELLSPTEEEVEHRDAVDAIQDGLDLLKLDKPQRDATENPDDGSTETEELWQDDEVQMKLWNPAVNIRRIKQLATDGDNNDKQDLALQRRGRVVHVCAPSIPSDSPKDTMPTKIMVGTLRSLQSGTCLFTPNDRVFPQFKCSRNFLEDHNKAEGGGGGRQENGKKGKDNLRESSDLYRAEYIYHSWKEFHSWPPCVNVKRLGDACSIEDQIQGLLMENRVDHGEFAPDVLKDVEDAVKSGVYLMDGSKSQNSSSSESKKRNGAELGWKPTPEMLKGRRDFRSERIFTIDPTTAKDLDDALHIKQLPDGRVEIGVHIADVSAFVTPGSAVDKEALRRATTVYLVDRTVPMLPRPLCEVACSLNENVERLAFSCVWRMSEKGETPADVWYGRTVIKSCARLDYSTAQNIIEKKVAKGEPAEDIPDELWPQSRRPTGGHTIEQVAADVRLMHQVAMARRRQRFSHGALALHGVKLTFQGLDDDGETPLKVAPYPIKDSNRLVEEYMLLANYLVAQRLITHAGDRAVLRRHPDPLPQGLEKVVDVANAMFDFRVDATSSAALHASLVRFERTCQDETVQKCMTQMLTTPMQNADYFAAGSFKKEFWRHFALNIPYYTHFTSPIRRYADVMVHRLLQATIHGQEAVDKFPLSPVSLNDRCEHCNEKRLAAKMAQERCDVIFLALYLRKHPMKYELGVVMSMGTKAITVFIPKLGVNAMLYMEEHKEWLEYESQGDENDRRLVLTRKEGQQKGGTGSWKRLDVKMFTKLSVSCLYKDKPRVDVRLLLEGPAT